MKTIKIKLHLEDEAMQQLEKYQNHTKELSDIINNYYVRGKGRSTKDGVSKTVLLTRAYNNHAKAIELSYTKQKFIEYFMADKKFNELYSNYEADLWRKPSLPSFKKHKKLKKIKVMTYAEVMQRNNATPVTIDYYGDITKHPSANSAARHMDMNILTLKKAIKHGYYQDENIRIYYT